MAASKARPTDDAFRARPARWLSALVGGAACAVLVAAAEPPARHSSTATNPASMHWPPPVWWQWMASTCEP